MGLLKNIQSHCQAQGIRLTEIREQVLNILIASETACGAYEILESLKIKRENAEPMTVYRALDFLCQHHLVHKIDALNRYVLCCHPNAKNCLLLICKKCGKKQEFHDDKLYEHLAFVSKKSCFSMESTSLDIYGLCQKCVSESHETSKLS